MEVKSMVYKTAPRNEDNRSKKIVFVSSCLLNANHKVQGLARYPGMCREVIDTLYENELGVMQLPCPETLYLGIQRWWATKNLYDNVGFRNHCRTLSKQMADYIESYVQVGYETVAVLSSNGSPTCGVDVTCFDEEWGGCPTGFEFKNSLVEGPGVFMEELKAEIEARKLPMPVFYGLALDDESASLDQIIEDFKGFIKGLL